ncbi:MAG TPA: thiamine-phosphate kinase [Myxococcales bacterium]|nr:thiamine-phosphate kinase [Myxococcales bacterium]
MPREFALIDRFTRHFPRRGRGLVLGPGDDCAVLRPSPGHELCATTDAVVEGVHFDRRFTMEDVGHKALAVNLSDLAAMGAVPRWFLVALELRAGVAPSVLDGLARGMAPLARAHGCTLAGGNLSRGRALAVTITALGELPAGTALRRDGLRPGDVLAVTGTLGAAALGRKDLRAGRRTSAARAQLRPTPRLAAGRAARGIASCAIDVSDGLAQDLGHLCDASGCGAELWASCLPAAAGVRRRRDRLRLCLAGGEDYELLLGVSPRRWPQLERRLAAAGTALTEIGRAVAERGLRLAPAPGGTPRPIAARGFDHF